MHNLHETHKDLLKVEIEVGLEVFEADRVTEVYLFQVRLSNTDHDEDIEVLDKQRDLCFDNVFTNVLII